LVRRGGKIERISGGDLGDGPQMWITTFSDPDNNYFQLMSPTPENMRLPGA
jgi:hypothetical protein